MPDEPPKPASIQTSISDSTITHSTVNLTSIDQRGQQVGTQYNAAGNITVTSWQPRWEPSAAEAQALLDALPTDRVPEITPLPSGSRMPFAPNPHFVGRDDVRVAIGSRSAVTGRNETPVGKRCSR